MAENATILLIEDDVDIHEAVKMILEPVGYTVICESTGPGGLAAMAKTKPDLVLLDIVLETPSEGFHIAYQMKEDDAVKSIPIIMLSAIGKKTGMDYAKDLGTDYVPAERFLEKPFDTATLRDAVKVVLSGAK